VPTVLVERGVGVLIHTDGHPPPHVHCHLADGEAVVVLEPEVALREQAGMAASDVRRAVALVRARRGRLTAAWRRLHP
jgi:hypothetical protein